MLHHGNTKEIHKLIVLDDNHKKAMGKLHLRDRLSI